MKKRTGELWLRHHEPFNGVDTLYYIVGSRSKRYKALNLENGKLEMVRERLLEGAHLGMWPYYERKPWQAWWEKIA